MRCAAAAVILVMLVSVAEACSGCGCRGGPGYRAPNGKCVGWAQLGKVCGDPPTDRCTAELVAPGTGKAAKDGQDIERLRQEAHPPTVATPP